MKDNHELKVGKKVPMMNVQMENIDGTHYSLDDEMMENGVMVVFSCNTCPFVVGNSNFEGWEKQYNSLYTLAKEKNIGFVLVNSNEAKRTNDDSKEAMIKHAKDMDYKMHYLIDTDSKLADSFGAKTTPHVFIVNNMKKLAYKGSIDNSWDSKRESLETYAITSINELSNATTLTHTSTPPRGCSIKRTVN